MSSRFLALVLQTSLHPASKAFSASGALGGRKGGPNSEPDPNAEGA